MSIDWENTFAALWRHNKSSLVGIENADPIRMEDLIGIEKQRAALIHNTELHQQSTLQQCSALGISRHWKVFTDQGNAE